MSSACTLDLFRPQDAGPLTRLLHAAYAELGAMGLNYTAVDQDEETTRLRAQAGRCWIARDAAGSMIGTITISLPPSAGLRELSPLARTPRRAWLNQLAVSPRLRGRGLARRLWEVGARWAERAGADSIGLDTAVPARHLVRPDEGWGFTPRETIHWPGKRYDSLVMLRALPVR